MRQDIHRPSVIDPEEYMLVAAFPQREADRGDIEKSEILRQERERFNAHLESTGGKFAQHKDGAHCDVCGAFCVDQAIFYHAPSNEYIKTGFDCAEKLDLGDKDLFRRVRDARHALEKNRAGKMKAQQLLEKRGLEQAWYMSGEGDFFEGYLNYESYISKEILKEDSNEGQVRAADYLMGEKSPFRIVRDLVEKLIRYGDLSEKQWNFLEILINRFNDQLDQLQKRAEGIESVPSAPEGEQRVQGVILGLKLQDFSYGGSQLKMLVEADDGYKVWSTVPKAIRDVEKGCRVRFTAQLQRSQKDNAFAIAKRPKQAAIIGEQG